jgi:hypothetical protein
VLLASGQDQPGALVVSGGMVYFLNEDSAPAGAVMRVPSDGGASVAVASAVDQPVGLAVGSGYVYWDSAAYAIQRAPLDGGAPDLFAVSQLRPGALAMDPGAMNWVASSVTSDVVRQALDSDAATVLATLPQSAEGSSIASRTTSAWTHPATWTRARGTRRTPTRRLPRREAPRRIAARPAPS